MISFCQALQIFSFPVYIWLESSFPTITPSVLVLLHFFASGWLERQEEETIQRNAHHLKNRFSLSPWSLQGEKAVVGKSGQKA